MHMELGPMVGMLTVSFVEEDEDISMEVWDVIGEWCSERIEDIRTEAAPPSPIVRTVLRVSEPAGGPGGGMRSTDIVQFKDGRFGWYDDEGGGLYVSHLGSPCPVCLV